MNSTHPPRYNTLNAYFRSRFGRRVRKIPLDAGFSCPNRDGTLSRGGCVFCNEAGSGTGLAGGLGLAEQWKHWRERFHAGPGDLFMAYLQSYSNTHGPATKVRDALGALTVLDGLAGISLGTRPDCLDPEKFDLLRQAADKVGELHLELGLQSADDGTLRRINRGHTAADFAHACREAHARGLRVVAHVIAGLPGEGLDHLLATVDFLGALPIHGIKFHNLYVCESTGMERLWRNGDYTPIERDEYVDWVCRALAKLRPDVVVHRLASDPADGELLAPDWAADKRSVLDDIRRRMETLDLRQGLQYDQNGIRYEHDKTSRPPYLPGEKGGPMSLMEWNDALVLGIDQIDEQHRMLVDMINELQEKTLSGQGKQAVADTLQGLKAYTVYHFKEEEALMTRASYAFIERHKKEHVKFVRAVEQFSAEAMTSSRKTGKEILEFLREWLVDHILGSDMILAGHLKKQR